GVLRRAQGGGAERRAVVGAGVHGQGRHRQRHARPRPPLHLRGGVDTGDPVRHRSRPSARVLAAGGGHLAHRGHLQARHAARVRAQHRHPGAHHRLRHRDLPSHPHRAVVWRRGAAAGAVCRPRGRCAGDGHAAECAQVDQRGADTWLYIHLPHVCLHPGRPQSPNGRDASGHGAGVRGLHLPPHLRYVRFAYPQRAAVEVIKGINLVLPRGSVTALVGGSGAGKSTVVQLLSQFYEPVAGTISLAGMDIASFDRTQWTRAISLVSQEPVLFAMSVRDNIAYGLPDADVSEADVIRAAKAANAHEFIVKLPQGYDTMVGERGGLLSGGQRQRLAIARAILKDAPILILDEATSALDSVSERLMQQALEGLMQGRTTLVIAHRLSTVQAADQIVVMAAGRLVERGTHAQLVAQGGAYATLVNAQNLTFE
ncbi:unnamed protein product, partial [Closterium sp. Naga37s-1]